MDASDPLPYPEGTWGGRPRRGRVLSSAYERRRVYTPPKGKPAPDVLPRRDPASTRTQFVNEHYTRVTIKGHKETADSRRNGLLYVVGDPMESFSIRPPRDGCGNGGFTPLESTEGECLVATNAGYFNTTDYSCHGTLVSDGVVENQSNDTNVSFGVTEGGEVVVGYLSEEEKKALKFRQLVNGVVWLVRDGASYITESIQSDEESMETQETGCETAGDCYFRQARAPRLALGHDAEGRILILAMDGSPGYPTPWGWQRRTGQTLDDMASLMIAAGAVNAINLDGGGSVSVFERGVLANSPTDSCDKQGDGFNLSSEVTQVCARRVTSVLCIRAPAPATATTVVPATATEVVQPETDGLSLIFGEKCRGSVAALVLAIAAALLLAALVLALAWRCTPLGQWCCARAAPGAQAADAAAGAQGGQEQETSRVAAVVPAYMRRPIHTVKKMRKKRGSRQGTPRRTEIDLELVNLPATGYDSDTSDAANAAAAPAQTAVTVGDAGDIAP